MPEIKTAPILILKDKSFMNPALLALINLVKKREVRKSQQYSLIFKRMQDSYFL